LPERTENFAAPNPSPRPKKKFRTVSDKELQEKKESSSTRKSTKWVFCSTEKCPNKTSCIHLYITFYSCSEKEHSLYLENARIVLSTIYKPSNKKISIKPKGDSGLTAKLVNYILLQLLFCGVISLAWCGLDS
jgi:hypothetical protein